MTNQLTRLRPTFAILKDKQVIPIDTSSQSTIEWATFMSDAENKRIGLMHIFIRNYQLTVSTTFLGINHSFGDEKPLWFETMVFLNRPEVEFDSEEFNWADQYMQRYGTYEEALRGHNELVDRIKSRQYPLIESKKEE